LLDAVTLREAHDGDVASPVGIQSHNLLQWVVGLQKQRWHGLFGENALNKKVKNDSRNMTALHS